MAENRGLPVAAMTQLRAKARASGVYFRVVKNTLVRRAVVDTPFAALGERMVGPMAYGIGTDPVAVAKVLNDFAKGNDKFVIQGGFMGDKVLDAKGVEALSKLPSLDQLRGKLIGLLQAPATKVAGVLQAPAGQLARVFNAYATKDAA